MEFEIGIGVINQSITEHPYIKTEGGHTAYVGDNILREQLNFYKFKVRLNAIIADQNNKRVSNFWSYYGLLHGQRSVIEDAIQKGFHLNYEKLNDDCVNFFEGKNDDFANNIDALRQISEIKLAESKLLGMFEQEIEREKEKGSVAIWQSITATTDFIYSLYSSGLPQYSRLMQSLTAEHIFTKEVGTLHRKVVECDKEEALSNYLSIPIQLYNSIIILLGENGTDNKIIESIVNSINEFVEGLAQGNEEYARQFKDAIENANVVNENQTYEPVQDKRKDDYSIL